MSSGTDSFAERELTAIFRQIFRREFTLGVAPHGSSAVMAPTYQLRVKPCIPDTKR